MSSIQKDKEGPDWPLGLIVVPTPGGPISIMSNVDPSNVNDPSTPTPGTIGADEYTVRCNQILIWGVKAAANGLAVNTGNIYLCRKGVGANPGNRNDPGSIVAVIFPGQEFTIMPSALVRDGFSPYRYFIDADNAGDSALVTLIIV